MGNAHQHEVRAIQPYLGNNMGIVSLSKTISTIFASQFRGQEAKGKY